MAWWMFQNLVITTVLAAAVAVACRVGRIGPVARHALWVLVLVKFVTPPLVVWPWAAPDPFGFAAQGASVTAPWTPAEPGRELPQAVDDNEPEANAAVRSALERPSFDAASTGALDRSPWAWLFTAWIFGSACLLAIEGVRLVRLARRISPQPADPEIVARVESLSAQLGIRPVPVVLVSGLTSPVVWAWGRPRLLWPATLAADLGDACIDGILVHELAHIRRRDHLVSWIELAAGALWWWNPLFWSVRAAMREQAELACDAWVISALPHGRRAYAESLLALSGAALLNPSMAAVGIRPASRRVLERRLVMIMKGRTALRLPGLGVCCLVLVAAATLPAWASAPQVPPPPAPPARVAVQAPPALPAQPQPAVALPQLPPSVAVRTERPVAVPKQVLARTPQPARKVSPMVVNTPMQRYTAYVRKGPLPEEGQKLLETLAADQKAIQDEAAQKLEARRAAAVRELEDLQEKYTKAGKLDEAVAIRDFLRAGGPGGIPYARYTLRKQ